MNQKKTTKIQSTQKTAKKTETKTPKAVKTNFVPPKNKNDLTPYLASLVKDKRLSVLIDSANLYHAANIAKLDINFLQIANWFKKHSNLKSLNFYTAFDPEDNNQISFMNELEEAGYRIIKKPIKVYENLIKGNMDIELAVDAIMEMGLYDILVLISGDGDFYYLVKALEKLGKKTIVISIGGFTSYELHQEADSYFFLNRIKNIWFTRSRSKNYLKLTSKNFKAVGKSEKRNTSTETQKPDLNNHCKAIDKISSQEVQEVRKKILSIPIIIADDSQEQIDSKILDQNKHASQKFGTNKRKTVLKSKKSDKPTTKKKVKVKIKTTKA